MADNADAIRRAFEGPRPSRRLRGVVGNGRAGRRVDLSRSHFPDARVYHRRDGVREWLDGLGDAFEEIRYEVEEITELGADRVLLVIRVRGHGEFSEIEVDSRFVPVFTFRGEEVVRMDRYGDRAEVLAAAGPMG